MGLMIIGAVLVEILDIVEIFSQIFQLLQHENFPLKKVFLPAKITF